MNSGAGAAVAVFVVLSTLLVLGGCKEDGSSPGQVPQGWEHAPGRWWISGTDTAAAFRPLDDLESMGVSSPMVYAASDEMVRQTALQRDQLIEAVKRSIVRLYRNEPEIVDSIFLQVAMPILDEVDLQGDPDEIVERNKVRAYQAIRRHFREPAPVLSLGEDIEVPYPDSLRENGTVGAVKMQVRVDEEGRPVAIKLVQGVHPVLNHIAMRATTEMRWQPSYLLQSNEWKAIPSWSRFNIHFRAPE